jgi:DivIVA domain-containing protein
VALTPDDVESKEFVRVMRGYDPAEVATFLRVVAAEMRRREQVVEAIEGVASGPLADEVVAVLKTAYEAAQSHRRPARRPAAKRPTAKRPAAKRPTSAPKTVARERPLRSERPLRANRAAAGTAGS